MIFPDRQFKTRPSLHQILIGTFGHDTLSRKLSSHHFICFMSLGSCIYMHYAPLKLIVRDDLKFINDCEN